MGFNSAVKGSRHEKTFISLLIYELQGVQFVIYWTEGKEFTQDETNSAERLLIICAVQ